MTTVSDVSLDCPFHLPPALESTARLHPLIEKYELALLTLLGFACFSVLIGLGYNALRHYIFRDFHKFDVIFDAGGRVSLSLTMVTATSQLMWPADFLQSPTIASKVGIGGSLWYTIAIVLSVLVFAVLCMKLKTRAPGAKTFPQIAYARFGKGAHILFCVVALFTNLVITANLVLAGKAAVEVLTKNSSNEFVCLLLAVLFGSYCLIGGLGTTFYISYFNTALIFISTSYFILKTTYLADSDVRNVTSMDAVYDAMTCLKGPKGNYDESFLTFRSESGLISGIVLLFMTIVIYFCDQANRQSKIAAKPTEGVVGFLLAAFLWFAIPTSISYISTLAYKTMSYRQGMNLLTDAEIDEGYITPFVVQSLLGKEGVLVLLTLIFMTLMSTGSGEVMSVSSILVYDIYKTHIRPFRSNAQPTDCVLCGMSKLQLSVDDTCMCKSSMQTGHCSASVRQTRTWSSVQMPGPRKDIFQYRHYEDQLAEYKSWCMIWIVIGIVPFGLVIIESGMNLNWAVMAVQVFIAPFLVPLFFTIGWARATGNGLIAGSIIGLVCGVTGMLAYGSTYEGGLSNFYTNTAKDYSILTGLLSGVVISIIVSVSVSMMCPRSRPEFEDLVPTTNTTGSMPSFTKNKVEYVTNDESAHTVKPGNNVGAKNSTALELEWQKTMSIDNPLNSYKVLYAKELEEINAVNSVLTTHHMEKIFRKSKIISGICAAVSFLIFLVLIPSFALSQGVVTQYQLGTWISVCQHWCLIATVLVVVIPPLQEGWQIWQQHKTNRDTNANPKENNHDECVTHI